MLFEAFRTWQGLTPAEAPLVFAPPRGRWPNRLRRSRRHARAGSARAGVDAAHGALPVDFGEWAHRSWRPAAHAEDLAAARTSVSSGSARPTSRASILANSRSSGGRAGRRPRPSSTGCIGGGRTRRALRHGLRSPAASSRIARPGRRPRATCDRTSSNNEPGASRPAGSEEYAHEPGARATESPDRDRTRSAGRARPVIEALAKHFVLHHVYAEPDPAGGARPPWGRASGARPVMAWPGSAAPTSSACPTSRFSRSAASGSKPRIVATCRARGITVTTATVLFDDVADLAIGLALAVCRQLAQSGPLCSGGPLGTGPDGAGPQVDRHAGRHRGPGSDRDRGCAATGGVQDGDLLRRSDLA